MRIAKGIISEEQKLCTLCGICCDGTLFVRAKLEKDTKEKLPEKIKQNYFKIGKKGRFSLPCPYFMGICAIYKLNKPDICSLFRCELLIKLSIGNLSMNSALKIVENIQIKKHEILERYRKITGDHKTVQIVQIIDNLQSNSIHSNSKMDAELLISQCILFESLLLKYFKLNKKYMNS